MAVKNSEIIEAATTNSAPPKFEGASIPRVLRSVAYTAFGLGIVLPEFKSARGELPRQETPTTNSQPNDANKDRQNPLQSDVKTRLPADFVPDRDFYEIFIPFTFPSRAEQAYVVGFNPSPKVNTSDSSEQKSEQKAVVHTPQPVGLMVVESQSEQHGRGQVEGLSDKPKYFYSVKQERDSTTVVMNIATWSRELQRTALIRSGTPSDKIISDANKRLVGQDGNDVRPIMLSRINIFLIDRSRGDAVIARGKAAGAVDPTKGSLAWLEFPNDEYEKFVELCNLGNEANDIFVMAFPNTIAGKTVATGSASIEGKVDLSHIATQRFSAQQRGGSEPIIQGHRRNFEREIRPLIRKKISADPRTIGYLTQMYSASILNQLMSNEVALSLDDVADRYPAYVANLAEHIKPLLRQSINENKNEVTEVTLKQRDVSKGVSGGIEAPIKSLVFKTSAELSTAERNQIQKSLGGLVSNTEVRHQYEVTTISISTMTSGTLEIDLDDLTTIELAMPAEESLEIGPWPLALTQQKVDEILQTDVLSAMTMSELYSNQVAGLSAENKRLTKAVEELQEELTVETARADDNLNRLVYSGEVSEALKKKCDALVAEIGSLSETDRKYKMLMNLLNADPKYYASVDAKEAWYNNIRQMLIDCGVNADTATAVARVLQRGDRLPEQPRETRGKDK